MTRDKMPKPIHDMNTDELRAELQAAKARSAQLFVDGWKDKDKLATLLEVFETAQRFHTCGVIDPEADGPPQDALVKGHYNVTLERLDDGWLIDIEAYQHGFRDYLRSCPMSKDHPLLYRCMAASIKRRCVICEQTYTNPSWWGEKSLKQLCDDGELEPANVMQFEKCERTGICHVCPDCLHEGEPQRLMDEQFEEALDEAAKEAADGV